MDIQKGMAFLWPNIQDEKSAKDASKLGWYAALFSAAATLFSIIVGNLPPLNYVDVVLSCIIGYGCLKMFRIAPIIGVLITLFEMWYKYQNHGTFGIMPLFVLYYVNAIRGTWYLSKLQKD